MDHVRYGTNTRYFVNPPKLPDDEVIEAMRDALEEIIPAKLTEFMERQDELFDWYQTITKAIDNLVKRKEFDESAEYFWTLYSELEFAEYGVINRWLKYYLSLAASVRPDREWLKQGMGKGISDEDIEAAKQSPIEEMFEGKLRLVGGRYIGRCPFHEEKTASFTIFTKDNGFYCFGCHKHGDSLDFYMLTHKDASLIDAVKALR